MQSVGDTAVIFRKGGIEDISVPIERIGEVLDPRPDEPALVVLVGRLQWLTFDQRWRFFLEKPPSPDPLCAGLGKLVPYQGELVNRIGDRLREVGHGFKWANPENVPENRIFFDEDGLHLTNGSQILVFSNGPAYYR